MTLKEASQVSHRFSRRFDVFQMIALSSIAPPPADWCSSLIRASLDAFFYFLGRMEGWCSASGKYSSMDENYALI